MADSVPRSIVDTMGARCPVHVSLADMAADGLTAKQTLRLGQLLAATRLYSCAGSTADGQKAGGKRDDKTPPNGREPSGQLMRRLAGMLAGNGA